MQKRLFTAAMLSAALIFTQGAWAEGHGWHHKGEHAEKFKNMTPEEREKFHAERKAKWDAMDTKEKVKVIEKVRAERRKHSDERWSKLSDEEKVRFVEERMKKHKDRHRSHHQDGE